MNKESDAAVDAADVKKQLESLVGHDIDVAAADLINLWYPAGAYSFNDGADCWLNLLGLGKKCNAVQLLDASGVSTTGAGGKRVFLLSDSVCFGLHTLAEPINIIATPRGTAPRFLTQTHKLVNNGNDVEITVLSWPDFRSS